MAVSRKIVLPLTFTDGALPVLRNDPILTDGSLMLVEPGHPLAPISSVPAAGATMELENIARDEAASLLSATESQMRSLVSRAASLTSTAGTLELSGKGGLHAIISQAASSANNGVTVALPTKVKDYLVANDGHDFFFSLWGRVTRALGGGLSGSGGAFERKAQIVGTASPGTLYLAAMIDSTSLSGTYPDTNGATGSLQLLGRRGIGGNLTAGTAFLRNIGVNDWTGTSGNPGAPPAAGSMEAQVNMGPVGVFTGSRQANAHTSWIFYRLYLEDLTVSGRSYAEVDALDQAQYTAEVSTSGGRYNGDTYTAPATIA